MCAKLTLVLAAAPIPGSYIITLITSENDKSVMVGERSFSIRLQGVHVGSGFDTRAAAGGALRALLSRYQLHVSRGWVLASFFTDASHGDVGTPQIVGECLVRPMWCRV
jgi:hypothetical protein